MTKITILASMLIFASLPALAQGNQANRGEESRSYATEGRSEGSGGAESGNRTEPEGILNRLSRSHFRHQIGEAIERVQEACAAELEDYCGSVTPGQGRISACMRAYSDQLSERCRSTLNSVSRNIRQAVVNMADDCLSGIKAQCANSGNKADCVEQKSASISPACHAVVAAVRNLGQEMGLQGMPVYSADNKDVGRVVEVQRGPNGQIQSVQIQIGRLLGLGDRIVTVAADQLQELADRIKLKLSETDLRSLPETKKQGT